VMSVTAVTLLLTTCCAVTAQNSQKARILLMLALTQGRDTAALQQRFDNLKRTKDGIRVKGLDSSPASPYSILSRHDSNPG